MTIAIPAEGTLLKIGDGGGPENFTTVAEVTNISGPKLAMDTADVTSHSSTGGYKEYIGTLLAGGDVDFDINYVPTETTHNATAGLIRDHKNKTKRNFKLVWPDTGATTWSFAALVTGFEPTAPTDKALTAKVTLKISGQPTLA